MVGWNLHGRTKIITPIDEIDHKEDLFASPSEEVDR